MSAADRVFICRMLEKIEHNKGYADKLGISNASVYNGKLMINEAEIPGRKGK